MKVLFLGFTAVDTPTITAKFSVMNESSPFGYDVIVVNASSPGVITGGNASVAYSKWIDYLRSWQGGQHKVIVLIHPYDTNVGQSNYSWLELNDFVPQNIIACGNNSYLGPITAEDGYVKNFLKDKEGSFSVKAYYKRGSSKPAAMKINSMVNDLYSTSFTWKEDEKEIIFLPDTNVSTLCDLLVALEGGSTTWRVSKATELESQVNELDMKIQTLEKEKSEINTRLSGINAEVNSLLENDIYLRRAVNSFNLTQTAQNPNPENFYEAVESIEKAFGSEREMQEKLGLAKNFIDKVMRRTNEFRHVAKDGSIPEPLTIDEKNDFTTRVETVVRNYIQYLLID